jgi:hypothetical protein
MGVNNEKEPLSGTTPERRLFDRSLHLGMQHDKHSYSCNHKMPPHIHTHEKDRILR